MFFARQPTDNWRGGSGTSSVIGLFFFLSTNFLLSLSLSRILLWKIISDSNTFISFCKVLFKMELHVYFMYFWGNLHLFLTFSTMEVLLKSVFHHKLFLALSKKVFPPKEKFSSMHIVHCTSPPSPSPPSFLIPYQSYCTAADLAEDESF